MKEGNQRKKTLKESEKENENEKIDNRKNEGPMVKYLPETAEKLFFYKRALIGNREAIEAKKNFEHTRRYSAEDGGGTHALAARRWGCGFSAPG